MIELHADERTVKEVRRYWLPIAARGIGVVFTGLIPLLALIALDRAPDIAAGLLPYAAHAYALAMVWFLFCWIAFSIAWVDYYLDMLIITSKRIIDIEQIALFSRSFSEMPIENVEDMQVEIHGFFPSALDFGTITVQSAGEDREFVIESIHHPHEVKDLIAKQYNVFQNLRTGSSGEKQRYF